MSRSITNNKKDNLVGETQSSKMRGPYKTFFDSEMREMLLAWLHGESTKAIAEKWGMTVEKFHHIKFHYKQRLIWNELMGINLMLIHGNNTAAIARKLNGGKEPTIAALRRINQLVAGGHLRKKETL